MKTLGIILGSLVTAAVAVGVFVWSGAYDIGADAPHWGITESVLATLRKRSVAMRGEAIAVPSDLNDPKRIADGAEHYESMCTGCHLAPGMKENEFRPGLYPKPPVLAQVHALTPGVAFWITKHGIKMSGMPAWGKTHNDDAIWNIVAFVMKLPEMTPEQYGALTANAESEGEHGDHHHGDDDAHDHSDDHHGDGDAHDHGNDHHGSDDGTHDHE